ncbi:MAG: hypothetical protein U0Z53_11045 [Blastocatellia bacterium]
MLKNAGYKDVHALLGGLAAWETAGGEMVKAPAPPPPTPAQPVAPPAKKGKPDAAKH